MDERQACNDLMSADIHSVFVDRLPESCIVLLPVPVEHAEHLPEGCIFRLHVALHLVANFIRRTRDTDLPGWIDVDAVSSDLAGS